jgi:hypothetical protein
MVPDIQRISKTSDTEMLAVDNSVVEIQTGPSSSRSSVPTSSRESPREKAI